MLVPSLLPTPADLLQVWSSLTFVVLITLEQAQWYIGHLAISILRFWIEHATRDIVWHRA